MIQKSKKFCNYNDSEKASGSSQSLTDNITRSISESNLKTQECQMMVKRLVLRVLHARLLSERLSYPPVIALNIHTGPVQRDRGQPCETGPALARQCWILKSGVEQRLCKTGTLWRYRETYRLQMSVW
jgi:hypothetical protein